MGKGFIHYLNEYGGVIKSPEVANYHYQPKITFLDIIKGLPLLLLWLFFQPVLFSLAAICIIGVILNASK